MKIIYKFATRSRPHKLFACLDNIFAMAQHKDFVIVVSADTDDVSMHNDDVKDRCERYGNQVNLWYGESANKVAAINRDMEMYHSWDILINMSDDMEFIKPGFDLTIIRDYESMPIGDVLMHYPDQAAGKALITMAIMDRKYYDRFGYIYNPEYKSLFCDNEQQEVAQRLKRHVYFKSRLFNHNHPAWGHGTPDALMIHTESFHNEDKATFERRKAINFDLK